MPERPSLTFKEKASQKCEYREMNSRAPGQCASARQSTLGGYSSAESVMVAPSELLRVTTGPLPRNGVVGLGHFGNVLGTIQIPAHDM